MSHSDQAFAYRVANAIADDQGEAYAEFTSEYDSYGRVAAAVLSDDDTLQLVAKTVQREFPSLPYRAAKRAAEEIRAAILSGVSK